MSELDNKFYVNDGLYDPLAVKGLTKEEAFKLVYTTESIDCYCVDCKQNSVFTPITNWPTVNRPNFGITSVTNAAGWNIDFDQDSLLIEKRFQCSRNLKHQLIYNILIANGCIQKIGQFPSVADLNVESIKQFKGILGSEYFKEYSKAIGLFSHGVGIGSFVYLRRIVENFIITPALDDARKTPDWDEAEYQKKRMKERIDALKDNLPQYLVSNKTLYSILSKGIHNLSENECLEYFPVIQSVLDLILTEMKDKLEIENKKKEMQIKLASIAGKMA
ncbi:MAG: short-chain dehydrogenase [Bacteroidetes bacterium]|nr:short-chain dehydrogenase [Bacteroidota bacterium]